MTFIGSAKITGLKLNTIAKIAAYTVTAIDDIIICGAGNQTFTVDLLAPVAGKILYIKNIGTGIVTVDADTTGGSTIDGETTQTLSQYDCMVITSDGIDWIII